MLADVSLKCRVGHLMSHDHIQAQYVQLRVETRIHVVVSLTLVLQAIKGE